MREFVNNILNKIENGLVEEACQEYSKLDNLRMGEVFGIISVYCFGGLVLQFEFKNNKYMRFCCNELYEVSREEIEEKLCEL